MNKRNVWGIIGAGWLGQEVLNRLALSGIDCWSTNRKSFDWRSDEFPAESCDILFLNTPPLTDILPEDFVGKIPIRNGQRIIFISSIAVYGATNGEVTERTPPQPETKNGMWLFAVEQLLLQKFRGHISIIRAGGLIGGTRHPVYFLANKSIENSRINLIHRNDLVEIIFAISSLEDPPAIVNAVAPNHPYKKDYYGDWVKRLNLPPIKILTDPEDSKIVLSDVLPSIYPIWICPDLDVL